MCTTQTLIKAEKIARSIRGSCILCAASYGIFVIARILTSPLSLFLRIPLVACLIAFAYTILIQIGKLRTLLAAYPKAAKKEYSLPLPVSLIIAALLVIFNVMVAPNSERLDALWDAITLGTASYLAISTFVRNTVPYRKYIALKQEE